MSKNKIVPLVDYGPLNSLIGVWKGNKGMDVSPEKVGVENSPFYETITFVGAGDLTNAEEQKIAMVRYHIIVNRKSNDEVFHDQVGYWLWDAKTKVIINSFTIPRGVCVLAGGKFKKSSTKNSISLDVKAKLNNKSWGILQSPFMSKKASTLEFKQTMTIRGKKLEYSETTVLQIYGRKFNHTDKNTLTKVK